MVAESFSPPPGPPPGWRDRFPDPAQSSTSNNSYAPPPGPPPSKPPTGQQDGTNDEPPAYHDWTVVPDTSEFPPPPSLGYEASPSGNAPLSEADRAHEWCQQNPLWAPRTLTPEEKNAIKTGNINLSRPKEFWGDLAPQTTRTWKGQVQTGVVKAKSRSGSRDACLLTTLPLYSAKSDSPAVTEVPKTIYYEVKLLSLGRGSENGESSIALGFIAPPYPTWRMPGWERASIGVHGDDGRRYVNDTWGGKDFVRPFRPGETLGLGMTFSASQYASKGASGPPILDVEVFFTRNGKKESSWDLHEERDANEDLGVEGLEGQHDLYAAIGLFNGGEFEIAFNSNNWSYRL